MGLLAPLREEQRASPENPTTNLSNPDQWLYDAWGAGGQSDSGESVNAKSVLGISAVWACVRVISEAIAGFPFSVIEQTEDSRLTLHDDPVHELIHNQPAPGLTPFVWLDAWIANALLWGRGFSVVSRNDLGPARILPVRTDQTSFVEDDHGRPYLRTRLLGREILLDRDEYLYLPGMSFDGIDGLSPMGYHRATLGTAIAQSRHAARFFKNNARIAGVLETPQKLKKEDVQRLRESWEAMHSGSENAWKTAILESDLKFKPIAAPPNDADFVGQRRFTLEETARIYKVPLFALGVSEKGESFASVEVKNRFLHEHTLAPWLTKAEQEISQRLLPRGRVAKANVDKLLRSDSKARGQFHKDLWGIGAISVNEIRAREDMDPIGPEGDVRFVPLNMIPAEVAMDPSNLIDAGVDLPGSSVVEAQAQEEEEEGRTLPKPDPPKQLPAATDPEVEARRDLVESGASLLIDAVARCLERAQAQVRRPEDLAEVRKLKPWIRSALAAPAESFARLVAHRTLVQVDPGSAALVPLGQVVSGFVDFWAARHVRRVLAVGIPETEADAALRSMEEGKAEAYRLANLAALETYRAAGIDAVTWTRASCSSAACRDLAGETIPIDGRFPGDRRHPPADADCCCLLMAART